MGPRVLPRDRLRAVVGRIVIHHNCFEANRFAGLTHGFESGQRQIPGSETHNDLTHLGSVHDSTSPDRVPLVTAANAPTAIQNGMPNWEVSRVGSKEALMTAIARTRINANPTIRSWGDTARL